MDLLDGLGSQIMDVKLPWLYTIRELSIHPGKVCREYVEGKRIRYVNPLKYALYITAIVSFVLHQLPYGDRLQPLGELQEWKIATLSPIALFFARNTIVLVLLLSPAIVLFLRMAYRKTLYNRTEINCFVFYLVGHNALIYLVTFSFFILFIQFYPGFRINLTGIAAMMLTYMVLMVAYVWLASVNYFKCNKIYAMIVSLLIFVIYLFTFSMAEEILGI